MSLFNACFFFGQAIGAALIGLAVDRVGYERCCTTGAGLLALCWWFARTACVARDGIG